MNVLWLGPHRPVIEAYLNSKKDQIIFTEEEPSESLLAGKEFLVSFGYRHLIPPAILKRFEPRAINIHISLLPWNRGADPNLWSFLEDTPKGVSIHRLSEKLDGGDILCQEELIFPADATLRSSYEALIEAAQNLFQANWPRIKSGRLSAATQKGNGSYHRKSDKEIHRHLLSQGWDTPVRGLVGKALAEKRAR